MSAGQFTVSNSSASLSSVADISKEPIEVYIKKAENGFILSVGCKIFVSESWADMSNGLALYFSKPEEAKKKYLNR